MGVSQFIAKRGNLYKYLSSIGVLFAGTISAQLVYLVGSMVITRLFSPGEFGYFAQLMALVVPFALIVTLRMEFAISLPTNETESLVIFYLTVVFAIMGSLVTLAIGFSLLETDLNYLNFLDPNLVTLGTFCVFLTAIYSSLTYWNLFRARFQSIAIARPAQAAGITTGQISFGVAGTAQVGLVAGHILGQLVGVTVLTRSFFLTSHGPRGQLAELTTREIVQLSKSLLRRYRKFPLISTPSGLMNTLSNGLPVILLGATYGVAEAGLFALMQRVVAGPLALLSGPFLDVFKEQGAREKREKSEFSSVYLTTLGLLAVVGLVPALAIATIGETLFAMFFGEVWKASGSYASALALMFYLRFVASPLSYSFVIAERQGQDFFWQLGLLLVTLLVFIGPLFQDTALLTVTVYGYAYALLYIVNLGMSYHAARHKTSP